MEKRTLENLCSTKMVGTSSSAWALYHLAKVQPATAKWGIVAICIITLAMIAAEAYKTWKGKTDGNG